MTLALLLSKRTNSTSGSDGHACKKTHCCLWVLTQQEICGQSSSRCHPGGLERYFFLLNSFFQNYMYQNNK